MTTGKSPFARHGGDAADNEIFRNILAFANARPEERKFSYGWFFNADCADFIAKTLVPEPEDRMDPASSFSHPFFKSINLNDLETKAIRPPYLPAISSGQDTSNFDSYDDTFDKIDVKVYSNLMLSANWERFPGFTPMKDVWATDLTEAPPGGKR